MIDEPGGEKKGADGGKAPDRSPAVAAHGPEQHPHTENPEREAGQRRNATQYIARTIVAARRALRAVGRVFTWVIARIDQHGPLMTTLATVAIAVLTAKYVTYSKAQWEATRDQALTTRRQLTAVIGVVDLKGPTQVRVARAEPFELSVRNHGGGAARKGKWAGDLFVISTSDPCNPIGTKRFGTQEYRLGDSIGPGQLYAFTVGPHFTEAEAAVVNSAGSIVMTGTIMYEDIFDDPHVEPFCFWLAKAPDGTLRYFRCVNLCPALHY